LDQLSFMPINQSQNMSTPNKKTITAYLDQDYALYGMYTLENRAIPSVIDGFKPTQRKIIYIADKVWKTGTEKPLKIFQLGGKVAADAHYHHGDCLDPDTEILLKDGSYLKLGEWFNKFQDEKFEVMTFDEEKNIFTTSLAHSPRVGNITSEEFEIELENGELIKCTENHPFLTNRGWIEARNLQEGDDILTP